MKQLHQKIQQLKRRAAPVTLSELSVDRDGKLIDLKVRAPESEERTIEGYLCVWGVRDTYGTAFIKGCFAKSIRERGPQSNSKYKITCLWMHYQDEPIGQFLELREDDYGLYFKAQLDEVPTAERALKQIRSGTLNQFSIGFDYVWDKMEYDEDTDTIYLFEVELYEGSVVTRASNHETYALRSPDQLEQEQDQLQEETDEFIKSIPRRQQLQLRQIIARHISLAKLEPQELRQSALKNRKPEAQGLNISEVLKAI